jgi:hypothetical protein
LAAGKSGKTETGNSWIALPDPSLHGKLIVSSYASTSNDTQQYHHDRDNQEDVNESAQSV